MGRLAATETVIEALAEALGEAPIRATEAERPPRTTGGRQPDLVGRRIVVTAGGTSEPIDPVRFIGNRSSGKMGIAIAQAALDRGADVTLIVGSVTVPLPEEAAITRVGSAAEMHGAVLDALPGSDALVMAAAVADFRPRAASERKIERRERLVLELEPTPDILAEASRATRRPTASDNGRGIATVLVGFAAETGSLERAAGKLKAKGIDLLVANDVGEAGSGFGTDTNRVEVFAADGSTETWPLLPKREVADRILDRVAALLVVREADVASSAPGGRRVPSELRS
jgi:phosphopantothenoylcysteine decarboxylase / phosphopantothenate---cysteine ligase